MSVHAVSLSSGIVEKLSSNITSGWNSVFMETCLNWVKCSWGVSAKYVTQTNGLRNILCNSMSQVTIPADMSWVWPLTVIVWILAPVHGCKTGRVWEFQHVINICIEEKVSSKMTSGWTSFFMAIFLKLSIICFETFQPNMWQYRAWTLRDPESCESAWWTLRDCVHVRDRESRENTCWTLRDCVHVRDRESGENTCWTLRGCVHVRDREGGENTCWTLRDPELRTWTHPQPTFQPQELFHGKTLQWIRRY